MPIGTNGVFYDRWQDMPPDEMAHFLRRAGYEGQRLNDMMAQAGVGLIRKSKKGVKKSVNLITRFLNQPMAYLSNRERGSKAGELFGLELELEGTKLTPELTIAGWAGHNDGSLRGKTSVEWVFASPATYDISRKRVDRLFKALKTSGAKLNNSYRTSTHVHLNYSDKYGYQIVNMFVVYTILEDILTRWCGHERSGNLFCLGARDAEDLVRIMEDCTFRYNNFIQFNNEVRYAGLNMCSLNKFGSIEIRTMRGCDKPDEAYDWLEIMNELYLYTLNRTKSPAELIEEISHLGVRGFMYEVFSQPIADKLMEGISDNDLYQSIYEGIRLIQMFAYTVSDHWNIDVKWEPSKIKMDDDKEVVAPKKKAQPFLDEAAAVPDTMLGDAALNIQGRILRDREAARAMLRRERTREM